MKTAKTLAWLGFVGIAAIMLLAVWNGASANGDLNCTGEGCWLITDSSGNEWLSVNSPLDNTKKRVAMAMSPVTFDPTLGGAFPDVTTLTQMKGEVDQSGDNLYDYQWIACGITADRQIVYVIRSRGTLWFVDCDTVETAGSLGFYGSWQDPFGEEAPAYGVVPNTTTSVRMPMMPPFE